MDLLRVNAQGLANDSDVIDEFLHWFATWVWTAQSNVADNDRALLFQILGMTYLVGDGTWSDERFVREVKGAVGAPVGEPASTNSMS